MYDLLSEYFGEYSPLLDADGNVIQGISGVNFQWIAGVAIFMLLLYCLFSTLGKLLGGKK